MMNCSTTSFNCLLSAISLVFVVSVCFFFWNFVTKYLKALHHFEQFSNILITKLHSSLASRIVYKIWRNTLLYRVMCATRALTKKNCLFSTSIKKIWFYLSKNWLSNCQLWHIYFASNRIIQELELIIVSYFGKRATHENSMRT